MPTEYIPLYLLARAHHCTVEAMQTRCERAGVTVFNYAGSPDQRLVIRAADEERLLVPISRVVTPAVPVVKPAQTYDEIFKRPSA